MTNTLICSLGEPLVNPLASLDKEKGLKTKEENLSSILSKFSKRKNRDGSYGRMLQESFQLTEEWLLQTSSMKWLNSGTVYLGGFLKQETLDSFKIGPESSWSDILETANIPNRYYLGPLHAITTLRENIKRKRASVLSLVAMQETLTPEELHSLLEALCKQENRLDRMEKDISGKLKPGGHFGDARPKKKKLDKVSQKDTQEFLIMEKTMHQDTEL